MHRIAACLSDETGTVLASLGAIDEPVFLRSSIKPFIAAAVIASGAADAFGFTQTEIALISASHNGEPGHVETARAMLFKAGIDPSALRCGAHAPYDEEAARLLRESGEPPTALHNNCSGKHSGILAMAKFFGAPLESYLDERHPAQQALLSMCARVFGVSVDAMPLGIDGCGIPTVALTLRAAARGFARFAVLRDFSETDALALARARDAVAAHPWYIAGTGRFDTALIEVTGGRVVCKGGAEAVHCDSLITSGTGLALKVVDGGSRAVAPAVTAILDRAGALDDASRASLRSFARPELRNVSGTPVGEIFARLPPSFEPKRS